MRLCFVSTFDLSIGINLSTIKTKMKQLIHKYQLLKVTTANELMPREGYYALGEPSEIIKPNGFKQILAKAYWTDDLTSDFIEVWVDLKSLYNNSAIGPTSNHYSELQDTVIQIQSIALIDIEYKGIPAQVYQVEWTFLGSIDKVIDLSKWHNSSDDEIDYYENELLLNDYEFSKHSQSEDYLLIELMLDVFEQEENARRVEEAEINWLMAEELLSFYESQELSDGETLTLLEESDEETIVIESDDLSENEEQILN